MSRKFILLIAFIACSNLVFAEPKPYTAKFTIFQDDDRVGQMTKTLSLVNDDMYRLTTSSKAKLFFVKVTHEEDAIFAWQNNQAVPKSYLRTTDTSFSSKRKTVQTFNWPTMSETGTYRDKAWDMELTDASHSRLTDIVQFQELLKQAKEPIASMAFLIHDRGTSKNETFTFESVEIINTPSGKYKTWRYRKTHNNPKRQSLYWFATELDFVPVRVQQFKDGEEQANMMLSSIEYSL